MYPSIAGLVLSGASCLACAAVPSSLPPSAPPPVVESEPRAAGSPPAAGRLPLASAAPAREVAVPRLAPTWDGVEFRGAVTDGVDRLMSSPRIVAAGERLADHLLQSPELARAGAVLVDRVAESPRLVDVLLVLSDLHPDWQPPDFAAHLEVVMGRLATRFGEVGALDQVLARTRLVEAAYGWQKSLLGSVPVRTAFAEFCLAPEWRSFWDERVGATGADAQLLSKIVSYFETTDGRRDAVAFQLAMANDPAYERLFLDVLEDPRLKEILERRLAQLFSDEGFLVVASEAVLTALDPRDEERTRLALLDLADEAAVQRFVLDSLSDLRSDPGLHRALVAGFVQLVENLRGDVALKNGESRFSVR